MNCPHLPTVPSRRVDQIDPSWFQTLNECLEYAMTHPQGDGKTIFNDPGGTLRSIGGGHGDAPFSASGYDGPFALSLVDNALHCSGGWLNRNGISMDNLSELVCTDLSEGTVVIRSELANGVWSTPVLTIVTEPDRWCFPVGQLTQSGEAGTFDVVQYPVCCAFILASEICLMSKIAVE